MKILLLLNIYKLSLFSVSPCRQLNSKPVYFVWTGAYTALLQAAPLPRCDAGGEGRKGGVTSPGAGIVRGAAAGNIFYIKSGQEGGWRWLGGTNFVM